MDFITELERELKGPKERLAHHPLYDNLSGVHDIRLFMEYHVFAVWDFMSLLKSLQIQLTCVDVPWVPAPDPQLSRFINEIVLGEESDVNELGEPKSHFEMYLDAMGQLGADTSKIDAFISHIRSGHSVAQASDLVDLDRPIRMFINNTFSVIASNEPHLIASAFTFGREDLIPDMFLGIIAGEKKQNGVLAYDKLDYYLRRHIEVDGDEHGPLSLKMVSELCGNDAAKWEGAAKVAKESLQYRIDLWDTIAQNIARRTSEVR
ncbi:MAG: DUF3050 domain-containing protein [Sediminicola sp.]|tara:strand:- start:29483 stop:30271 length:789 start_codon:yes stop_codon:yes gene_type:complete